MDHFSTVTYQEKELFESDINGFKMIIDGDKQVASSPKPLLLSSLGACTGIDVVAILNKMRVKHEDFAVRVNGKLTDEHPKIYKEMEVIYDIRVDEADREKVEKAVNLSKDKYCGVSAMLKEASDISYTINFL